MRDASGARTLVKGVQPEHLPLLSTMGFFDALRHQNHLIDTLEYAVSHARHHAASSGQVQTGSMRSA